MSKDKDLKWITVNGAHIPIKEGQTAEEAKKEFFAKQNKSSTGDGEKKKLPTKKVVKIDMDADVQKKISAAKTPKERQEIAFRYIMDNLRGKYAAEDGRTVAIEKVGADKMTYLDKEEKLRVAPALAELIKAGKFEKEEEAIKKDNKPHKLFKKFAYYSVTFQIGNDRYSGLLNIGIRKDGSSTLYDLNPYSKQ